MLQLTCECGEEIIYTPDVDICSSCGEHAEFCRECGSNCCGARAVYFD